MTFFICGTLLKNPNKFFADLQIIYQLGQSISDAVNEDLRGARAISRVLIVKIPCKKTDLASISIPRFATCSNVPFSSSV